MNEAVRFLRTLAQTFSAMLLYQHGHPARERAVDRVYQALRDLQDGSPTHTFTFLSGEVVLGRLPLRELRQWEWSARLASAGIQRLELLDRVTREDLEAFLEEALLRLGDTPVRTAEVRQGRPSSIRYGEVSIRGEAEGKGSDAEDVSTATLSYTLGEEIGAVDWLQDEVRSGRRLQIREAEAVVRSLSVAMHGDQAFLMPLLRLKEYDQYTVTHTINVSVLTMALAEFLGLSRGEVRAFGIAGLLHDVGKVKVPDDILNKPGPLTEQEREVMNTHPIEGARLVLATPERLDLAAVVAYEHHLRLDGKGYPRLRYRRDAHEASKLVHVCDFFDALRTRRPYRDAWPTERILTEMEAGAGSEFDAEYAGAFVRMMRQWEGRVANVPMDAPELRGDALSGNGGPGGTAGHGADETEGPAPPEGRRGGTETGETPAESGADATAGESGAAATPPQAEPADDR